MPETLTLDFETLPYMDDFCDQAVPRPSRLLFRHNVEEQGAQHYQLMVRRFSDTLSEGTTRSSLCIKEGFLIDVNIQKRTTIAHSWFAEHCPMEYSGAVIRAFIPEDDQSFLLFETFDHLCFIFPSAVSSSIDSGMTENIIRLCLHSLNEITVVTFKFVVILIDS